MENLEDIQIIDIPIKELEKKGYFLYSYDGALGLPSGQYTRKNINCEGNLTLEGSKVIATNALRNLENVIDVKIAKNNDAYDVYALTK